MRGFIVAIVLVGAAHTHAAAQTSSTPPTQRSLQLDVSGEFKLLFGGDDMTYLYLGSAVRTVLAQKTTFTRRTVRSSSCGCKLRPRHFWSRSGWALEGELRSGWLYGFDSDYDAETSDYVDTKRAWGAALGVRWFYVMVQRNVRFRMFTSLRAGVLRSSWFAANASSEAQRRASTSPRPTEASTGMIRTLDFNLGYEVGGERVFFTMATGFGVFRGETTGLGGTVTLSMGLGARF